MKKRWRSKSRKSAGSASPTRSGEPTSPCRSGESTSPVRSGETAASSGRSGERPASASAAPDGEGGDERMQHRSSEGGDGSPSPGEETAVRPSSGEETAVRPKQKCKKHKKEIKKEIEKRRISYPVLPMSSGDHMVVFSHKDSQVRGYYPDSFVSEFLSAEARRKRNKERKRCKKAKRREAKQREREKQGFSAPCVQHDALVIEEPSAVPEQQHHKTSSLSPNPTPTIEGDCFTGLQGEVAPPVQHDALVTEESSIVLEQQQHKTSSLSPSPSLTSKGDKGDAGEEDSAVALSGKIKGKGVVDKACQRKITPSDSTQKSNVGGVPGHVEEATRTYASLPSEKESSKEDDDATILKKGCLEGAELLMESAPHASYSSSWSGDAQEEAPFDEEETSSRLKVDKKPIPSYSGDCAEIAQNIEKDGHPDKNLSSVAEDEQHSDKIGVQATGDHEQEQGGAREHVQALLDMDSETILDKICYFTKCLKSAPRDYGSYHPVYEEEQLMELYEQLALYRIRGYELTVDRKLDELDDTNLKLQYPTSSLYDNGFFRYYEESLEWYFDLERCQSASFDNYQRLVLRDCKLYHDWDFYSSTRNTYEEDLAYVQYFEEVARETKWIEDYVGDSTVKWDRIEGLAYIQALEIAARLPNVSLLLISCGFREYICRIWTFYCHRGLDCLYFEIWKRVVKGKMSFKEALLEIQRVDMFPMRSYDVKCELEETTLRFPLKKYYDAHVAGIDKTASDDKVRQLIREAVIEMLSRPKNYLDYAREKMDIAKDINLIPKGRRA